MFSCMCLFRSHKGLISCCVIKSDFVLLVGKVISIKCRTKGEVEQDAIFISRLQLCLCVCLLFFVWGVGW